METSSLVGGGEATKTPRCPEWRTATMARECELEATR